ncbi:abortive infection protein [Staphylococcus aureus]|uniref:Abortive infection protein n=1 Tax=Staphylococcus aureus TaxID=1280 RepID=A0A380DTK6_STAAU|nr:abortive infection protein [Staphylococcus aureus]
MTRLWASLLTVIIYILSQFLPLLIVKKLPFVQYSGIELTKAVIYIQLVLFLIAATTIILINLKIKNPTKLELEVKEPKKIYHSMGIAWICTGNDLSNGS